jgi:glycosyltransferase involved in cell wall biosynthesis
MLALPSRGENFGHIVPEAWAAGCPVLVSDRTPWRNLAQQGVGWDLPLEPQVWVDAVQRCLDLSADDHYALRQRAVARSREVWREGLRGDAVLKELLATLAQRREVGQAAELSSGTFAAVDSGPCR